MKICYLQAAHTVNGRHSLRGRALAHHLGAESELTLRHYVSKVGDEDLDGITLTVDAAGAATVLPPPCCCRPVANSPCSPSSPVTDYRRPRCLTIDGSGRSG